MIETAPQKIITSFAWYAASDWLKPEEAVCCMGHGLEAIFFLVGVARLVSIARADRRVLRLDLSAAYWG